MITSKLGCRTCSCEESHAGLRELTVREVLVVGSEGSCRTYRSTRGARWIQTKDLFWKESEARGCLEVDHWSLFNIHCMIISCIVVFPLWWLILSWVWDRSMILTYNGSWLLSLLKWNQASSYNLIALSKVTTPRLLFDLLWPSMQARLWPEALKMSEFTRAVFASKELFGAEDMKRFSLLNSTR